MYDLIIVGLGPAGSTLARLLGDRLHIAAIDQKTVKGGFEKPCGGLLAPDAQKALAAMKLTLPKDILVDPQIFSVRTIDLDVNRERYYQRFYLNLDRHRFDLWLRGMIPPSVDLFADAACTGIEKIDGGWRVTLRVGGILRVLETRWLAGADGANSFVRRTLFPTYHTRSYVSIQQWFHDPHATPFYSCIFDSENTDCYSWALSKDDKLIFGGAYPPKDCRARFERQKVKLAAYGITLGEPLKTESCLVLRPASHRDFFTGTDNVFFLGEAAGFISPSSLEGISSALRSAIALANALVSPVPAARYRAETRRLRAKLTLKLLKCPFMYAPFLRRAVMRSGFSALRDEGAGEAGVTGEREK